MINKIAFLSIISLFLFSCKQSNSNPSSATEALHIEIMAIHDEVMPKTSDLHREKKKLQKLKKDIPQNNASFIKMIDSVINDLDDADDKMMEWMKRYKKPNFKDSSEETMTELNVFKDRIEVVAQNINTALDKAGKLDERFKVLEEYKKGK